MNIPPSPVATAKSLTVANPVPYNFNGRLLMAIYDPIRGKVIDAGSGGTVMKLLGLALAAFLLVVLLFSSVARVESGHGQGNRAPHG